MMISLFSSARSALLACESVVFLFVMARRYDGAAVHSVLLLALLGSALSFLGVSLYATALHHRLLLLLYSLLRPDDFIRAYEPLLEKKRVPANIRFTLTAYLSHGYTAKGDFEHARALLACAPRVGKRRMPDCELVLLGNLASIALCEGNAEEAGAHLARLAALARSGKLRKKKRAEQEAILVLLSAELNILEGKALQDACDRLRGESKQGGSALRQTELAFYIGRAYAALGETSLARTYLTQAAKAADTIRYGELAAKALRELPSSASPGSKKKK